MTRAEYLEFVQEGLAFPDTGVGSPDPSRILYDELHIVDRLKVAHQRYVNEVADILGFPDAIKNKVTLGETVIEGRTYIREIYLSSW